MMNVFLVIIECLRLSEDVFGDQGMSHSEHLSEVLTEASPYATERQKWHRKSGAVFGYQKTLTVNFVTSAPP